MHPQRRLNITASLPDPLVINEVTFQCLMAGDAIDSARWLETKHYCFDCDEVLPDERCKVHPKARVYIKQSKADCPLVEAPQFRLVAGRGEAPTQVFLELAYCYVDKTAPTYDFQGRVRANPSFGPDDEARFILTSSSDPERLGKIDLLMDLDEGPVKRPIADSPFRHGHQYLLTGSPVPLILVAELLKHWSSEVSRDAGISALWLNPTECPRERQARGCDV